MVVLAGCVEGTLGPVPGTGGGGGGGPRLVDGGAPPGDRDGGGQRPGEDGGDPPGEDAGIPGDMCGDVRATAYVHYGTVEPSYLALTPGQKLAIALLDLGGGLCSGLVIAPRWALSAAHCAAGSVTLHVGSGSDPDQSIAGRRFINNPSYDIALVELAEDATVAVPGLEPIRVIGEDLDRSWVGRDSEASGYGNTERGSTGRRFFSHFPINNVTSSSIIINGGGEGGVCYGDSGGPIMVRTASGAVRTIGVVSTGDGTCTYEAEFTRADIVRDWIEEHTGPTPPDGPVGCGDITAEGRCIDGRASWCESMELQTEACAGGTTCGWDATARGFRCVTSDPCLGADGYGRCDGQVATWCESGVLRRRDCAACGQSCGPVEGAGGIYCSDGPPPPTDPCEDGTGMIGRCNGDVVEWCQDGMSMSRDCADRGERCRWISDSVGYDCG
jgi:hypothetical protein